MTIYTHSEQHDCTMNPMNAATAASFIMEEKTGIKPRLTSKVLQSYKAVNAVTIEEFNVITEALLTENGFFIKKK